MNNAKVTIITRTIPKREHFLERNIKCVLSQTFSNYEHIIIVDDENIKVVQILVNKKKEKYKGRCKIIRSNPPYGNMEAASNNALKLAKGDYVSFLDDDDTWEPTFLEEVMCFFETNNFSSVRGVVTESTIVNETVINGAIREDSRVDFKKYPNGVLLFDILGSNQFTNNSFVYMREALKLVGMYDEKLPVQGDWDFNIRFLRHYDIGVIPKPLANYHLRYSSGLGITPIS